MGKTSAAQIERADIWMVQIKMQSVELVTQKCHVKGSIMCHKSTVFYEILKFWKNFLGAWLTRQHLIGDVMDFLCVPGNFLVWIDEAGEMIDNRFFFDGNGTKFNYPMPFPKIEPRRFDVKNNIPHFKQ